MNANSRAWADENKLNNEKLHFLADMSEINQDELEWHQFHLPPKHLSSNKFLHVPSPSIAASYSPSKQAIAKRSGYLHKKASFHSQLWEFSW